MQMMGDERSKEVLEHAKQSKEGDEEGIEGWRITEHGDWLDVKKEEAQDVEMREDEPIEEQAADGGGEDPMKVMKKFKEGHPGIEVIVKEREDVAEHGLKRAVTVGIWHSSFCWC